MTNHNSDFLPVSKFIKYYQLNRVPETMFLIEAERFDTPADTATNTQCSEKGIIFGLAMIATLIVLSVFQLYRSLEVAPANPEITKSGVVQNRVTLWQKITKSGVAESSYEMIRNRNIPESEIVNSQANRVL